jgi:nicotinamidase-related amidase
MESAVLMLMDLQVGICGPGGLLGSKSGLSDHTARRHVLDRAAGALEEARKKGVSVIHVGVAFDDDYANRNNRGRGFERFESNRWMLRGSEEAAFNPQVAPVDGEIVIRKGCVNPFIGTNLMEILVRLGAGHLYLGGTATNYVVESTARHAGDTGFAVTVLEDLCASYNQEMHDFAIQNILPMFASIGHSSEFSSGA